MRLPRVVLLALVLLGCRDSAKGRGDSEGSLPPVFPSRPANSTNWDVAAGPVMLAGLLLLLALLAVVLLLALAPAAAGGAVLRSWGNSDAPNGAFAPMVAVAQLG